MIETVAGRPLTAPGRGARPQADAAAAELLSRCPLTLADDDQRLKTAGK
jgi:hypothetical protein